MSDGLASAVVDLAEEAGRAVMAVYAAGPGAVQTKDDGSPLTAADLASDQVIAAGLARLDAATPVLSEESSEAVPAEGRRAWGAFWCVDPLDGTKEFISRTGEFTVNIALVVGGQPVFGVVHAPALAGRPTWWGGPAMGGVGTAA